MRISLNKVLLIGEITGTPEIRYMPSGDKVVTAHLVTVEEFNGKEYPTDITVVGLKTAAEVLSKLTTGDIAYVEGRIVKREWTNKYGSASSVTEVRAFSVRKFFDMQQAKNEQTPAGADFPHDAPDNDIPF